jgi:cytochrome c553
MTQPPVAFEPHSIGRRRCAAIAILGYALSGGDKPMRIWAVALLAGAAACHQQPKAVAKPAEITFDGAQVTGAAAIVTEGERMSRVLGCRGCHRDNLQGGPFFERYASNLTRELPKYTDAELDRVLRTGVPRDGRELWGMPSELFQHASAADEADLIGYLRTLKPEGKPTQPPKPWTKEAKELIAKGEIKSAHDTVIGAKSVAPVDLGPKYALGRYITMVTCAECHGPKLEGGGFSATPNLIIAGGYTRAEFERLITQGIPTGGRKLDLMREVAVERFSHLTPHERDALYAYLKARAEKAQ